jgi:biopolymer transport protein ExbD
VKRVAGRLDPGGGDLEEAHEINVTPFIDVMLVLLIIFMVAAPLATVDIAVDLPPSTAQPQPRPDRPLYLTLREDLSLVLDETPIDRDRLAAALAEAMADNAEERIFLRADRSVGYGELMDLMNLLRSAGYTKVALVGLESAPQAMGGPSPPS